MIKSFLWAFIIMILPIVGVSQASISIGKPYRVVDAAHKHYFSKGNEVMTIKIEDENVIIQKFNSATLQQIKKVEYEDLPKGYVLEAVKEIDHNCYIFYSLWDRNNETEQLFAREIDFESGMFNGAGERIIAIKGKVTGALTGSGYWNFSVTDKFEFNVSSDKSKILIQYRLKPEIKNDDKNYDVIGFHVFDAKLRTIWSKEVKMPYTEKKMNNIDYSVDSEGNAYVLSTVYEDNTTNAKKKGSDAPNYHIELIQVQAQTGKISITPVKLYNKFISRIWLYESPSDNMVCAGFYNKEGAVYNADGIFVFKIGKEGNILDAASYEIPVEILNQYESKRSKKKNKKKEEKGKAEFEDLVLNKFVILEDGSFLLIGEQNFIVTRTHMDAKGNSYSTTTYYYNDILTAKINPDGQLAWMKKLPKRQLGRRGKGSMSFKYMYGDESHYFLFLDNERNLNLPVDEAPAYHHDGSGGFLTAYKVDDNNGSVKKISILNTRNVNKMKIYQFLTSRILPLTNSEFVFEVYKKKKEDVLIKVKF